MSHSTATHTLEMPPPSFTDAITTDRHTLGMPADVAAAAANDNAAPGSPSFDDIDDDDIDEINAIHSNEQIIILSSGDETAAAAAAKPAVRRRSAAAAAAPTAADADDPKVLPLRPIIRGPYDDDDDVAVHQGDMTVVYAEPHTEVQLNCDVDLDVVRTQWLKDDQVRHANCSMQMDSARLGSAGGDRESLLIAVSRAVVSDTARIETRRAQCVNCITSMCRIGQSSLRLNPGALCIARVIGSARPKERRQRVDRPKNRPGGDGGLLSICATSAAWHSITHTLRRPPARRVSFYLVPCVWACVRDT